MTPKHTITYETPSPVKPRVYVMTFEQLFDMTGALARRRDELLRHYRHLTPEQQQNVREELADLQTAMDADGSDTSMAAQLDEAGFGSGGIL